MVATMDASGKEEQYIVSDMGLADFGRKEIGIAGKNRAIEHFTVKRMAKDYAELLR